MKMLGRSRSPGSVRARLDELPEAFCMDALTDYACWISRYDTARRNVLGYDASRPDDDVVADMHSG